MNTDNRESLIKQAIILSVISMLVGIFIYIFLRPTAAQAVHFIINIFPILDNVREITTNYNYSNWLLYNLPDALWVYSYTVLIVAIWGYRNSLESKIWLSTVPIICIGYEIAQYFYIIKGTYDIKDVIYSITAIVIGSYTIKIIKEKREGVSNE